MLRRLAFSAAAFFLLGQTTAALAATPPTLVPVIAEPSRDLTNCAFWCVPRDVIAGSDQDIIVLIRRKPAGSAVDARKARLVVQGDHRGHYESLLGTVVPGDPGRVTVRAHGKLPPDHYSGAVLLDPSNAADQVVIPFSLDVRSGPEFALLALLCSVFAGWLINTVFGLAPKRDFSTSAEALRKRINALPATEKGLLTPLFDDTWALRGQDLDTARKRLDSLEAAVRALRRTRELQDNALSDPSSLRFVAWLQRVGGATAALIDAVRAYAPSFDSEVATVQAAIEGLRDAAAAEEALAALEARAITAAGQMSEYQAFAKAVKAVRTAIDGVPADPSQSVPPLKPLMDQVYHRFELLEQAAGAPLQGVAVTPGTPTPTGVGATIVATAGALGWPIASLAAVENGSAFDTITDIAKLALPLASMVVAVVILTIGFKVAYLDNATFGASVGDWLALIAWGLAAWGTRQTLTGLGPPATKSS